MDRRRRRRRGGWRVLALLAAATGGPATGAWAQTTVTGNSLALRSTGSNVINQNGYVGTYVTLAAPGSVTLSVNAQSAAGATAAPHMNIVVDDSSVGFDVANSLPSDYGTTV